jgi:hypothetical protein
MQQVSWRKNWEICCSLGMTPLTLDSASEQQCLSKVTTDKDWKGNFNYWSGGTQQDCRGSWGWCGAGAAPKYVSDELKWEPGQPDNLSGREDCMHLKNFVMAGMLMLTDRNCTDRYIFACKVQICLTHILFTGACSYDFILQGKPERKPGKPDCPATACAKTVTNFWCLC